MDVRVLCATKKDLKRLVEEGRFREDLYYRLNVVVVELPPLRERTEDILLLAGHFLRSKSAALGRPLPELSPEVCKLLLVYPWPGNVRELEHVIEHALAISRGPAITLQDLPLDLLERAQDVYLCLGEEVVRFCLEGREAIDLQAVLHQVEREAIQWALHKSGGNQAKAAQLLGIPRTTLRDKLADL